MDSRPRSDLPYHLALGFVQICFALFPLAGKLAFEGGFDRWAVAVWRIATGAVVLSAIALWAYGRRVWIRRADLPRFILASQLGIALNQLCFLEGLRRTPTVNAAVTIGLIPATTYAVALLLRAERWNPWRGLGVLVGFGAILPLSFGNASTALGNSLLLANTLAYSIYLVISRPLTGRYPPVAMAAWMFVLSAWVIPVVGGSLDLLPTDATALGVGALLFIVIFPTCVTYLLNIIALARLPASTTAVYVFVQPPLIAVAAVIFRAEALSPAVLAAGFGVMVAMALVIRPPRRASLSPVIPAPPTDRGTPIGHPALPRTSLDPAQSDG